MGPERDRLGRRRQPGQERGLRPIYPSLPEHWVSRPLRVAMSEVDWARFDDLVGRHAAIAPTQARAIGSALSALLDSAAGADPGPLAWMDWERHKSLKLLRFIG